jgi:tRNA threonylcarbamoyladenosine biosynthesis protein TsaB
MKNKKRIRLYIDTSRSDIILIEINERSSTTEARSEKSQKLLPFILEKLAEYGVTIYDVTEIEVVTGPGSFTGIRVGVAVANALGWSLGIRVNTRDIEYSGPIEPTY